MMAWQNIHTHRPKRQDEKPAALPCVPCVLPLSLFSQVKMVRTSYVATLLCALRPRLFVGVGLVALQPIDVRCRRRRGWFACQAAAGGRHTILLIQMTERASTRTYHDYDTMGRAWDGV